MSNIDTSSVHLLAQHSAAFVRCDDNKNMQKKLLIGSTGSPVLLSYLTNAAINAQANGR